MPRFSIARSLRLALIGLTIVLAIVATQSRNAITVVIVAALLALIAALTLIAALVSSMRRPLDELADAQRRIEDDRRRLAVTIESLADALIVTEPGSSTIATVNPRASQLVPELLPGGRVDQDGSP